jgi:C4-dicarboxylate-specific signal transduction histidine kinase
MPETSEDFKSDINDIAQIFAIPAMLNVICQTTGMGFAAVARVTEDRWVTCSVRDDIGFGLKPGDELEIRTTICNEIRQSQKPVVIDHVSDDPYYKNHHTPLMYGFQSYISMPIMRKDGTFFGTLCAIDPNPHNVSAESVTAMFILFTDLISFHLNAIETARITESKLMEEKAFSDVLEKQVQERTLELNHNNAELERMNKELQAFAYISSHDLQEPLRKIQTIASAIIEKESNNLSATGRDYFRRMQEAAQRMQTLINDLLAYSRTSIAERKFESTDLNKVLGQVEADLKEELQQKNAVIKAEEMCHANIIPFQFRQLLYNLVSNSLKFLSPDRPLVITITSTIGEGKIFNDPRLTPYKQYCHIRVSDNGIGFDQKYSEKIFEVFQRLFERSQY